jgi:cbb3-type cytochrome oxidase subunit 3
MKQEILTQFPWPWMPIFAMMIFLSFFMVLIVRVSMKSRRHIFNSAENLPLHDGEKCGREV